MDSQCIQSFHVNPQGLMQQDLYKDAASSFQRQDVGLSRDNHILRLESVKLKKVQRTRLNFELLTSQLGLFDLHLS